MHASSQSPHNGQAILHRGVPLSTAAAAMVLLHGRGASAESILELAGELRGDGFAFLAPQAAGSTWYPSSFLAPVERNERWLSSALQAVDAVMVKIAQAGIPPDRTMVLGFSQGACLALEYAARFPRRYGGVVALSGGLIGEVPGRYSGSLRGTPVFLGCSDRDPHIPKERVEQSATILEGLGGSVTTIIYPMMDHTINDEELIVVRGMMAELPDGITPGVGRTGANKAP